MARPRLGYISHGSRAYLARISGVSHVVELRVVADGAVELGHDRLVLDEQPLDLHLLLAELVLIR